MTSTPRIYNKAICMVFEHLWSVLYGHFEEGFGYHAGNANPLLLARYHDPSLPLSVRIGGLPAKPHGLHLPRNWVEEWKRYWEDWEYLLTS